MASTSEEKPTLPSVASATSVGSLPDISSSSSTSTTTSASATPTKKHITFEEPPKSTEETASSDEEEAPTIQFLHKDDASLLRVLQEKVSQSPIYLAQFAALEEEYIRQQQSNTPSDGFITPSTTSGFADVQKSFDFKDLNLQEVSSASTTTTTEVFPEVQSPSATYKKITPNTGFFMKDMSDATPYVHSSALQLFLSNSYNAKKHNSNSNLENLNNCKQYYFYHQYANVLLPKSASASDGQLGKRAFQSESSAPSSPSTKIGSNYDTVSGTIQDNTPNIILNDNTHLNGNTVTVNEPEQKKNSLNNLSKGMEENIEAGPSSTEEEEPLPNQSSTASAAVIEPEETEVGFKTPTREHGHKGLFESVDDDVDKDGNISNIIDINASKESLPSSFPSASSLSTTPSSSIFDRNDILNSPSLVSPVMKRSGSSLVLDESKLTPLSTMKKRAHRRVQSFNVVQTTSSEFGSEYDIRSVKVELLMLDIDKCFQKYEPLRIASDLWVRDLDFIKFGVRIFDRIYVWLEDSLVHQFSLEKSDLLDCPSIEFTLPEQPLSKVIDMVCYVINEYNTKHTYSYLNCHSFSFARRVIEKLTGKRIKSKHVLPKTLVKHYKEWRDFEKKKREKEEKENHSPRSDDKNALTETKSEMSSDVKTRVEKDTTMDPIDYLDLINEEERMRDVNFIYYVPKRLILKKYRKFHQKQELKTHTYLINLVNSLLDQCPKFKDEYKFDYFILKALDRRFWYEKYSQENFDLIKQKTKFLHKEGIKLHFSEPTFLKDLVKLKKERRRKVFDLRIEDNELDVDPNDPQAKFWKNNNGDSVTNFSWIREEKKDKTIKVLSMDGGGMKGLILIEMLLVIEERVGKRICEIFDLVAGTSTGGIVALLVNRGCTMKVAKEMYIEIGRNIFDLKTTRNKSFVKTMKVLRGRSWYDGYPLEMTSLRMSQDVDLNDLHKKKPLTFLVSTLNKSTNPAIIEQTLQEPTAYALRSYSDPYLYDDTGDNSKKLTPSFYKGTSSGIGVSTIDAIRATSAAPMYFKCRKIGDSEFIDGAVVANNPTAIALYEAKKIFPDNDNFVFLSLGTGLVSNGKGNNQEHSDDVNFNYSPPSTNTKPKKKGIMNSSIVKGISQTLNTLLSVVNLQLSSERIHKMVKDQIEILNDNKRHFDYFRFNVPGLGDKGLDEVDDELFLLFEKETKAYILNHPELDRLCTLLKNE